MTHRLNAATKNRVIQVSLAPWAIEALERRRYEMLELNHHSMSQSEAAAEIIYSELRRNVTNAAAEKAHNAERSRLLNRDKLPREEGARAALEAHQRDARDAKGGK